MRIKVLCLVCIILLACIIAPALLAGCDIQENQNVTLLASNPGGNQVTSEFFSVVNPDATLSPFTIPNNKVFVVTDMDITFANASPDRIVYVQLLLIGGNLLASFLDTTMADANGDGGLHASLTTGVEIGPNTEFGVRASSGDVQDPSGIVVSLHGYFKFK